jgi:hypothetical protein
VAGEQFRAVLLCDFLSIAPLYIETLNSAEEHHLSAVFCNDWLLGSKYIGASVASVDIIGIGLVYFKKRKN